MFQKDDNFLAELGLADLPEEQKKPFLEHFYSELELRVGEKLSEGLSEAQVAQFEKIIDSDENEISTFLQQHAPDYKNEPNFQRIMQVLGADENSARVRQEFASAKWLEVNRPNYKQVVESVMAELKKEVAANRDSIVQ